MVAVVQRTARRAVTMVLIVFLVISSIIKGRRKPASWFSETTYRFAVFGATSCTMCAHHATYVAS